MTGITRQTRDQLRQAMALLRRDEALLGLMRALDPDGTAAAYTLATETEALLRKFQGVTWRRMEEGFRRPQSDVERYLLELSRLEAPCKRRQLYSLYADLMRGG